MQETIFADIYFSYFSSFIFKVNYLLKILSRANSLIANNNIRSVILEIKTTDKKLLISNMTLLISLFANYVFMEEKNNSSEKVVIDEEELNGVEIDGI